MTQITICLDIVSPWSYFAYYILKRYRKAWDFELIIKPYFLGGVMQASGNQPPLKIKNKGIWMNKVDLPLFAEMSGIPYTFPETFPINTIHIMRFLRAVEQAQPEKLEQTTDFFWELVWNRKEGPTAKDAIDPSFFSKKLVSANVFTEEEVKKLVELSQSGEIKDALKNEAGKLVEEKGAFGFPWIIVEKDSGKRSFFGADRFEHIAFYLGKEWDGPKGPGTKRGQSKL
ncbi:uncharacterized protein JCM6883_002574 [Sporobolomyces salmoneus]|uniref:uncharacterized protein n=1 Tax=Sporobolomyces salmoneus TaxID=183962 RepID=UPI003173BADD